MPLSFFRALNPVSENSGTTYSRGSNYPCENREMLDLSVAQRINNAFQNDYYLLSALVSTYESIIGCHYDLYLRGGVNARGGSKGVLDFLIFPLIARKLIADHWLPENWNNIFLKLLVWVIGFPIETIRVLTGIVLTIVLSPFVLLIHSIKIWNTSGEARLQMIRIDDAPELGPGKNHDRIEHLNLDIPTQFRCAISLEIMTDPVFVINQPEHRFERSYIVKHLKKNQYNPLNRDDLSLEDLQEDVTVRNQIEQYIEEQLKNAPFQTANKMWISRS